jgi:hypothetical protein
MTSPLPVSMIDRTALCATMVWPLRRIGFLFMPRRTGAAVQRRAHGAQQARLVSKTTDEIKRSL